MRHNLKILLHDDNFALLISKDIMVANLARTKCSTQHSCIHRTTTTTIIIFEVNNSYYYIIETNQILLNLT